MGHVAIVGHLERLWPHGVNEGQGEEAPAFSLNLSASLVRDDKGLPDGLDPGWEVLLIPFWGRVKVRVRVVRGAGAAAQVFEGQSAIAPIGHGRGATEGWANPLRGAILEAARGMKAAGWDAFLSDPAAGPAAGPERVLFPHLLAYASTWPFPVPQVLNLALSFRLDASAVFSGWDAWGADDRLIAAPEFLASAADLDSTRAPKAGVDAVKFVDPTNEIARWDYDDVNGGPPLCAYANAWKYKPPPEVTAKRYFDLASYWIKPSPDFAPGAQQAGSRPGEDWLAELPARASDAFDAAKLILDGWRDWAERPRQVGNPPPPNDQDRDRLATAAVAALRDRASVGLRPEPGGLGLASSILDPRTVVELGLPGTVAASTPDLAAREAVARAYRRAMLSALRAYDDAIDAQTWREVLHDAMVAGRPDWPSATDLRAASARPDGYKLLETARQALRDDRVLMLAMRSQWEAAANPGRMVPVTFFRGGVDREAGPLAVGNGSAWVVTVERINGASSLTISLIETPAGVADPEVPRKRTITLRLAIPASGLSTLALATTELPALKVGSVAVAPADLDIAPAGLTAIPDRLRLVLSPTAEGLIRVEAQGPDAGGWKAVPGLNAELDPAHSHVTSPADRRPRFMPMRIEVSGAAAAGGALHHGPADVLEVPREFLAGAAPREVLDDAVRAWDEGMNTDRAERLWEALKPRFETILASLQVARRQSLAAIGRGWPRMMVRSSEDEDRGRIKKRIADELAAYAQWRFDAPPGNPPPQANDYVSLQPRPDVVGPLPDEIDRVRRAAAMVEAANLVPDPSLEAARDEPLTRVPHPVGLQVDRVDSTASDEASDRGDLLRSIAGVGLLICQKVRDGEFTPWTCANIARFELRVVKGEALPQPAPPPIAETGVVASRLAYQADALQAILTYDNHPLIAQLPAASLTSLANPKARIIEGSPLAQLMRLAPSYLPCEAEWAILPSLKFGQTLRFLPFLVGNGGTLPAALVDAGAHPSALSARPPSFEQLRVSLGEAGLAGAWREVLYVRRVGIGPPRFDAAPAVGGRPAEPLRSLPAIPETVAPLAREARRVEGLFFAAHLPPASVRRSRSYFHSVASRTVRGGLDLSAEPWTIRLERVRVIDPNAKVRGGFGPGFELRLRIVADGDDEDEGIAVRVRHTRGNETPGVMKVVVDGVGVPVLVGDLPLSDASGGGTSKVAPEFDLELRGIPDAERRKWTIQANYRVAGAAWEPAGMTGTTMDIPAGSSGMRVDVTLGKQGYNAVRFRPPEVFFGDATASDPGRAIELPPGEPLAGTRRDDVPILILTREQDHLHFGLRKPAADLQTWDRWTAMDQWQADLGANGAAAKPFLEARIAEWAETYRHAKDNPPTDGARQVVPSPESSQEEPALSPPRSVPADFASEPGGFACELVPIHAPPDADAVPIRFAAIPRPTTRADGRARSDPVRVEIRWIARPDSVDKPGAGQAVANPRAELTTGEGSIRVAVPAGEVWELRVYSAVPDAWFSDPGRRFADSVRLGHRRATAQDGTGYYLFSPFRLLVEGASRAMPKPEHLWLGLRVRAAGSGLSASFALPPDPRELTETKTTALTIEDYAAVAMARGVVLHRQVWRWGGRPVTPFPSPGAGRPRLDDVPPRPEDGKPGQAPPSSDRWAMLWDAEGFADRDDADHLETSATLAPAVEYGEPTTAALYSEGLEHDLRALYYRFLLIARSRYEGMIDVLPVAARHPGLRDQGPSDGREPTGWRRLYVPCRSFARPDAPKVRIVLPLTEDSAGNGGPGRRPKGVLVVVDEPWFEVGGLAEEFQYEVLHLGQDPILDGGKARPLKVDTGPVPAIGPIGHTFDAGTANPRLLASSFFLELVASDGRDLAGHLAQVRFRRVVRSSAVTEPLESDWTAAQWIQFLPDSGRIERWAADSPGSVGLPVEPEALRVSILGDTVWIVEAGNPGRQADLGAWRSVTGHREVRRALLLTESVTDVRGQAGRHERYLSFCESLPSSSGSRFALPSQARMTGGARTARLLTIERRLEILTPRLRDDEPARGAGGFARGVRYDPARQHRPTRPPEVAGPWHVVLQHVDAGDVSGSWTWWVGSPNRARRVEVQVAIAGGGPTGVTMKLAPGKASAMTLWKEEDAYALDRRTLLGLCLTFDTRGVVLAFRTSTGEWRDLVPAPGASPLDVPESDRPDRSSAIFGMIFDPAKDDDRAWLRFVAPYLTLDDSGPWDQLLPGRVADPYGSDAASRILAMSPPIRER